MRAALARHDEMIRSAVEGNDGHVVKSTGDGAYAVFGRAQSAAAAAIATQELFTEELPGVGRLKLRVALHTGEADERDGDYFGTALNRTARLLGTGHGGQILVSSVTRDVLSEQHHEFVDLGTHRLRDLARPEHVYQLLYPGSPHDFAPLKSVESRPNNLPLQLSSFIGREREVDQVTRLVTEGRLVTLTGVGGAGKTRLAIQAAGELLDAYADGAWFVDLAPISDAELVIGQAAAPFGVRDLETDADHALIDVLCNYLSDKDLLIVLDNCEHLLDEAASVAHQLLTRCPKVDILATSRGLLGLPGETAFSIPPMELPDKDADGESAAVRLFVERASNVRPGFALGEDNADAVRDITRRLDGLPLAIELAASRIKVLAPAEILARLDNQLRLTSSRGLEGRHATLEAAMAWSYDLLTPVDREVFACLSVFSGGWALEAAVSLSGLDEFDVLETLEHLVDQSLVEVSDPEAGRRYRLLEPVRQYATAKLEESSHDHEVRRMHAEYFARLAEEGRTGLRGPDQERWIVRLQADHDNMRAAIDWCLDQQEESLALEITAPMGWFWWLRGLWPEALRWFWKVYRSTEGADPLLRARLVYGVAAIEVMRVRPAEVAPLFMEALTVVERDGSPTDVAWVKSTLAEMSSDVDRLRPEDGAAGLALEAMKDFESAGDRWAAAYTRFLYGQTLFVADDPRGVGEMEGALDELLELGDKWTAAWLGFVIGHSRAFEGDYDDARRLIVQSGELVEHSNDRWIGTHCTSRLGVLAAMEGKHDRARELFDQALPVHMRIGDQNCEALIHTYMGEILTDQGNLDDGEGQLREALAGYQDLENDLGIANGLRRMGWLALARGNRERAAVLLAGSGTVVSGSGGRMSSHDARRMSESTSSLRAEMAEGEFDTAWRRGEDMTAEELLSYALGRQGF